jgi:hypothetical protein
MALRKITDRRVVWRCTSCGVGGHKQIETTESAERHADETGHTVFASGMLQYVISQGTVADDDPFVSQTARRENANKAMLVDSDDNRE